MKKLVLLLSILALVSCEKDPLVESIPEIEEEQVITHKAYKIVAGNFDGQGGLYYINDDNVRKKASINTQGHYKLKKVVLSANYDVVETNYDGSDQVRRSKSVTKTAENFNGGAFTFEIDHNPERNKIVSEVLKMNLKLDAHFANGSIHSKEVSFSNESLWSRLVGYTNMLLSNYSLNISSNFVAGDSENFTGSYKKWEIDFDNEIDLVETQGAISPNSYRIGFGTRVYRGNSQVTDSDGAVVLRNSAGYSDYVNYEMPLQATGSYTVVETDGQREVEVVKSFSQDTTTYYGDFAITLEYEVQNNGMQVKEIKDLNLKLTAEHRGERYSKLIETNSTAWSAENGFSSSLGFLGISTGEVKTDNNCETAEKACYWIDFSKNVILEEE